MIKLIFKIIGIILAVFCFLITIYFFFRAGGSGFEEIKELFSNGFWEGIKEFFVSIWNGFKTVVGLG